jgi:hypothetical protein
MPQFSDDLFLGTAYSGGASSAGPSPMEMGVGPMGRVYIFDVVPLTLQAAGLAASQNPASGASFILAAGTGVTTTVDAFGVTRYVLDTPRCVTVTATGANTATYTITGYDVYGQRMTQTIAAPSTSTVATTKAFKSVISVTNANATLATNGLTVGFNDKLGLPIRVTNVVYVLTVKWDSTLAQNAGTFVAADTTDPATASTTDVRGCYTPSSAADGSKRLIMAIAVPAIGCGPNATRAGAFGVTQV